MGRPLIKSEDIRSTIKCYFSLLEREEISAKARRAGLPISTFIRESALKNKVFAKPVGQVEHWKNLSLLHSNLNQALRLSHSGKLVNLDPSLLVEISQQVQALRLDLMGNHHDSESH